MQVPLELLSSGHIFSWPFLVAVIFKWGQEVFITFSRKGQNGNCEQYVQWVNFSFSFCLFLSISSVGFNSNDENNNETQNLSLVFQQMPSYISSNLLYLFRIDHVTLSYRLYFEYFNIFGPISKLMFADAYLKYNKNNNEKFRWKRLLRRKIK